MSKLNISKDWNNKLLNAVYVRKDEIPLWTEKGFVLSHKEGLGEEFLLMTRQLEGLGEKGLRNLVGKEILGVYNKASALEFKINGESYILSFEFPNANTKISLDDRVLFSQSKEDNPWFSNLYEYKELLIPSLSSAFIKDIILEKEDLVFLLEKEKDLELRLSKDYCENLFLIESRSFIPSSYNY